MSGSVNRVILVGNLTADPELRRLASGDSVVNMRLATSESWRDKSSGERKEKAEYHSVVVFDQNICKVAEQYLKKGSLIHLEGSLATRSWEDQSGVKKYATEVVIQRFGGSLTMLGSPPGGREDKPAPDRKQGDYGASNGAGSRLSGRDLDDDLPFAPEFR